MMNIRPRYWRARPAVLEHYGVFHKPALQPEDYVSIAMSGRQYPFRYKRVRGEGKKASIFPDLPCGTVGLLMNYPAAEALLPLIKSWVNIQSDVLVEGEPTHILAIVTEVYDAMNAHTTIGRRGERSGIWLEVSEMHLVGSLIGPSPIFRLATTGVKWDFILSEEIFETIRSNGLTGLTLEEVVVE